MAFMVASSRSEDKTMFQKRIGWKDDDRQMRAWVDDVRGQGPHQVQQHYRPGRLPPFQAPKKTRSSSCTNGFKGLVTVKHKKNYLDLPDKRYRKIICRPTASILRVAEAQ